MEILTVQTPAAALERRSRSLHFPKLHERDLRRDAWVFLKKHGEHGSRVRREEIQNLPIARPAINVRDVYRPRAPLDFVRSLRKKGRVDRHHGRARQYDPHGVPPDGLAALRKRRPRREFRVERHKGVPRPALRVGAQPAIRDVAAIRESLRDVPLCHALVHITDVHGVQPRFPRVPLVSGEVSGVRAKQVPVRTHRPARLIQPETG